LFEGKTPEQAYELLRILDWLTHMGVIHGVIKKRISGAYTDTHLPHCRKTTMIQSRMRIQNSILMSRPVTGFV